MNDLVLKGGRVVDPSQGLDEVTDIAFASGRIAAIGDGLAGKDMRDVKGKIVSPGLIDLHTHVYWRAPATSPAFAGTSSSHHRYVSCPTSTWPSPASLPFPRRSWSARTATCA
jgi:imidazolonepropionase-like amidohydrolase